MALSSLLRIRVDVLVLAMVAAEAAAITALLQSGHSVDQTTQWIVAAAGAATALAALLAWRRSRKLRSAMRAALAAIEAGDAQARAAAGKDLSEELGAVSAGLDRIAARATADARIRNGVDAAGSPIMVADATHKVVYMNASLRALLERCEADIARHIPGFAAERLLGSSIDVFHKDPSGSRAIVEGLTAPHPAPISMGPLSFLLTLSPVFDGKGARSGTIAEWRDITDELRTIREIDAVITAAVEGDFSRRADFIGAPDVLKAVAQRVNNLAEAVQIGVTEIGRVVRSISDGDLTAAMSGQFNGAFAELQQNSNEAVRRLSELVSKIAASSSSVQGGGAGIRTDAQELASRADQQAAALKQTAAAMEEMSTSIKSNADSSSRASALAADAAQRADAGGQIVKGAVSAMTEIEAGASKISEIVSVIDAIAFQTNLLALNAAVEAARAGEAGKGFAIVASEVRALAQRSSDASQDIRQLIEKSSVQVAEGVRLVTDTGSALEGIVASINDVEEAVRTIAAVSTAQASSVEEVSSSIAEMDHITQQNACLAEKSASSAHALAGESESLQSLIEIFRIGEGGAKGFEAAASPRRAQAASNQQWADFA